MNTLICCYFWLLLHLGLARFMKHQYVIEVENIHACPDNDKMESPLRNLKYIHLNRTHRALSYDVTYIRDLDKNVGALMHLHRWGDGGWIQMPFLNFQPNMCETYLRYFRGMWVTHQTALGVKHPDKCPVPAGNYSLKNFVLDTSSATIPFFSGRFRTTTISATNDMKIKIHCLMVYINVMEKV